MPASPLTPELEALRFESRYSEFDRVVRRRRSIRRFTDEPLSEGDMRDVLDAALLAPNSSNLQAFEFYWVRSTEKKRALVEACLSQSAARTARELVVCVARWDQWNETRAEYFAWLKTQPRIPKPVMLYYESAAKVLYGLGPLGIGGAVRAASAALVGAFRAVPRAPFSEEDMRLWAVKSAALACENLMLAATAKGFDTCAMEGMDPVRVGRIVGLEGAKWDIPMVIALGHRSERAIWATQWRRDRAKLVHEI